MTENTLGIIKPDGVKNKLQGKVLAMIEENGLRIVAQKMMQLTQKQAQAFYAIHKERPFFNDLCNFMASGPVVAFVLKGENAVEKYRNLMGATDPNKAEKNTLRGKYATSIDENLVHGSDSAENAKIEISQFFSQFEIAE
jgi:nucleoside-diphosphate kinase